MLTLMCTHFWLLVGECAHVSIRINKKQLKTFALCRTFIHPTVVNMLVLLLYLKQSLAIAFQYSMPPEHRISALRPSHHLPSPFSLLLYNQLFVSIFARCQFSLSAKVFYNFFFLYRCFIHRCICNKMDNEDLLLFCAWTN